MLLLKGRLLLGLLLLRGKGVGGCCCGWLLLGGVAARELLLGAGELLLGESGGRVLLRWRLLLKSGVGLLLGELLCYIVLYCSVV